jgi:phosphocarrier protein
MLKAYEETMPSIPPLTIEKIFAIPNRAGMHGRPSALFVQLVKNVQSNIYIEKLDNLGSRINGKSIIGLLCLGLSYLTEIRITVEGEDAKEVMSSIEHLFELKFEEE